jgi:hypothetical protein
VNSILGSGSLSRNLAVTLSAISGQGQTSAGTKTLVKADSHGVGAHGHDPVAFVMEGKPIKRKFPRTLTTEAFIERRTNDENNWTIGYCSDDAGAIGMLTLFFFYVDMCIHVKKTSTKCHQFV